MDSDQIKIDNKKFNPDFDNQIKDFGELDIPLPEQDMPMDAEKKKPGILGKLFGSKHPKIDEQIKKSDQNEFMPPKFNDNLDMPSPDEFNLDTSSPDLSKIIPNNSDQNKSNMPKLDDITSTEQPQIEPPKVQKVPVFDMPDINEIEQISSPQNNNFLLKTPDIDDVNSLLAQLEGNKSTIKPVEKKSEVKPAELEMPKLDQMLPPEPKKLAETETKQIEKTADADKLLKETDHDEKKIEKKAKHHEHIKIEPKLNEEDIQQILSIEKKRVNLEIKKSIEEDNNRMRKIITELEDKYYKQLKDFEDNKKALRAFEKYYNTGNDLQTLELKEISADIKPKKNLNLEKPKQKKTVSKKKMFDLPEIKINKKNKSVKKKKIQVKKTVKKAIKKAVKKITVSKKKKKR